MSHSVQYITDEADATEIVGLTGTGKITISALRMNRPQLLRIRRMWVKMNEHPPR